MRSLLVLLMLFVPLLSHAASLRVRIARAGESGPLEVKVGVVNERGFPTWKAARTVAAGRSSVVFDDLAPGPYALLVSGREPLQRLMVVAAVQPDGSETTVTLPRGRIRGRVMLAGAPLAGTKVGLIRSQRWQSELVTDAKGEFVSAIWERGQYDLALSGGPLPAPRLLRTLIDGPTVTVDLPQREIRGVVVDRAGAPVANARIALSSEQADNLGPILRVKTDAEGRFRYAGVAEGRHTLHVRTDDYLRVEPLSFELTAADELIEKRVTLDRGFVRSIAVVDDEGAPLVGASVVCVSHGRVRASAVTDARGRVSLTTPADEESVLVIVPREGSFATHRLPSAANDERPLHTIAVPPAAADLDVSLLGADAPLVGVSLLMRFNGELFTPEITRELRNLHRLELTRGDHGRVILTRIPLGVYEFWPYDTAEEAAMLAESSVVSAAPIVVNVVTGENKVKVRFERR